jgi:hypothetical protein
VQFARCTEAARGRVRKGAWKLEEGKQRGIYANAGTHDLEVSIRTFPKGSIGLNELRQNVSFW